MKPAAKRVSKATPQSPVLGGEVAREGQRRPVNPSAIPLSKRANVLLLEHARVLQKDGRVLYLTKSAAEMAGRGGEDELLHRDLVRNYFNIPQHNTALLLLGTGTSITDSAARLLADANVMVCFTGGGGAPLGLAADPMFLVPQSEYLPTEYMQAWMRMWLDEVERLRIAKAFLRERLDLSVEHWDLDKDLQRKGIRIADQDARRFEAAIKTAESTEQLLSAEGVWAKSLDATLARGFGIKDFTRIEQPGEWTQASPPSKIINAMISNGNYIANGYAAIALHALGISFALPVLHGKTRRGALVFDVADIFKDWTVMPLAFHAASASKPWSDQQFRNELIDRLQPKIIDTTIDIIKNSIAKKSQ